MRIIIELDDKTIEIVEKLAKAEKRKRKQTLELIIEERVQRYLEATQPKKKA